jgi:hypothetical protein
MSVSFATETTARPRVDGPRPRLAGSAKPLTWAAGQDHAHNAIHGVTETNFRACRALRLPTAKRSVPVTCEQSAHMLRQRG